MTDAVKPFVSIIMPAFNAAKFISEAIDSVCRQSFIDWELIVVDDGSTDRTAGIVKELQANDNRIHYIYQQNKKQAAARNTGILAAKGEWIAFLDADDIWLPDKLEAQLKALQESDADLIFTSGWEVHEKTNELSPYNSLVGKYNGRDIYKVLFKHNPIAVLSVMMRSSIVKLVGLQDENPECAGCEDWDYWLRCSRANISFLGLEDRTFNYRVHSSGTSQNVLRMRIAACYVLFKNFQVARFDHQELKEQIKRLKDLVGHIVMALYEQAEIPRIRYYLRLLKTLPGSNIKYTIAELPLSLLKGKSKRITSFLIYH